MGPNVQDRRSEGRVALVMGAAWLLAASLSSAQTLTNGDFANGFDGWTHRTAYAYWRDTPGGGRPDNPDGTPWVEFGNGSWAYQQIGTWTAGQTLRIQLAVGSIEGRDFPGLYVSLWAGGNPGAAADADAKEPTTLELNVGATQIALSELIQPAALTAGQAAVETVTVELSTGSGQTEGTPLWLLLQSAGPKRVLIGSVTILVATTDPQAVSPEPASGTEQVERTGMLRWGLNGAETATFSLNIGTTEACDDVLVGQDTGDTPAFRTPAGLLAYATLYYWRVDVTVQGQTYPGPIWSFRTEPYSVPLSMVTATASNAFKAETGPEKTVDGSGLDADDHHGINLEDMWVSGVADGNVPWIAYTFDQVYRLDRLLVWNANSLSEEVLGWSAREVVVETSLDGVTWTPVPEVPVFAAGAGRSDYAANTVVDLRGAAALAVRLTVVSTWGQAAQVSLSEVRFYAVPMRARWPEPTSGSTDVDPEGALSWRAGRGAAQHAVLLGEDPNALEAAGTTTEPILDLGPQDLTLGRTYTWRVEEVNEAADPTRWVGPDWTFATPAFLVVDDMETYRDLEFQEIWATWADGFDEPAANGAVVGNGFTGAPEIEVVHGGWQALPLHYDNTTAPVSHTTRTLSPPQDWTRHGIRTLVIYLYGAPDNTGGLFLEINGRHVDFAGPSDALQRPQWVLWPVDLTALGADLTAVTEIRLGVSGVAAKGTVIVDDLQLRADPVVWETPATPSDDDPNLVAYYAFEGNAADSAGGHDAAVMGEPRYVAGRTGQAIALDGFVDAVVYPLPAEETWSAAAVSFWVRTDELAQDVWSGIVNNNSDGSDFQFDVDGGDPGMYRYNNNPLGPVQRAWTHLAMSCDGTGTDLYYNGLFVRRINGVHTTFGQFAVGTNRSGNNAFGGEVDELRIYDRSLSAAEVAGLAGLSEAVAAPF